MTAAAPPAETRDTVERSAIRKVALRLVDSRGTATTYDAVKLPEPAHYAVSLVLPHDGRSIAEVRGTDPVGLMQALDAMPAVQKTSLFGTAVHAVFHAEHNRLQAQIEDELAGMPDALKAAPGVVN